MGSQILQIYDALADIGINIDGTPIVGRKLADASTVVNSTPIRIISPLSSNDEGKKISKASFGKMSEADWSITDLLLYNRTSDGSGIENDMYWLAKYQAAYTDMLNANRKLGFARHVLVTNFDIEIGIFRFPVNGDKWYHGAKASLMVHEIIP